MTTTVGGMRRQPVSVAHLNCCKNPKCGNRVITKMNEYARCNVCGWDSRMTPEDIENRFGKVRNDFLPLRTYLKDFDGNFSGPAKCSNGCGVSVVTREDGASFEESSPNNFKDHDCPHAVQGPSDEFWPYDDESSEPLKQVSAQAVGLGEFAYENGAYTFNDKQGTVVFAPLDISDVATAASVRLSPGVEDAVISPAAETLGASAGADEAVESSGGDSAAPSAEDLSTEEF